MKTVSDTVSSPALGDSGGTPDSGLCLAIASEDLATLIFTIGDDGNGSTDSGRIDAGGFFFGAGTSMLQLVIDPGVLLTAGDKFTLID
ncbi:MAG: hypothetical protein GC164_07745 [Phycisphaera sp.]|nr:hypothetical protein [Phycisphaera sp.]